MEPEDNEYGLTKPDSSEESKLILRPTLKCKLPQVCVSVTFPQFLSLCAC
jgi:hypothetical protein